MRSVKSRLALLAALAVAFGASAALASTLQPERTPSRPAISLAAESPVVVSGRRFRPRERVTVVVVVPGEREVAISRANRRGAFSARFETDAACGPLLVTATGRQGSKAALRLRRVPAPCGADLAPGPG